MKIEKTKNAFSRKSYADAVNEAYSSSAHSPAIWWDGSALVVRSALTDCGILIGRADYSADTGKKLIPSWADALEIVSRG